MSINDYVEELEQIALNAALQSKAIELCFIYKDTLINQYDPDRTKLAYAIATNLWKQEGRNFERQEIMESVDMAIKLSADECGECTKYD